jgi:hypothetical protein
MLKQHPALTGAAMAGAALVMALAPAARAARGGAQEGSAAPAPVDPQQVQDQQEMTWADDRPIPGVDWADPSRRAPRTLRVALVAVDFPDQPFVITMPKGSDPYGNPQACAAGCFFAGVNLRHTPAVVGPSPW